MYLSIIIPLYNNTQQNTWKLEMNIFSQFLWFYWVYYLFFIFITWYLFFEFMTWLHFRKIIQLKIFVYRIKAARNEFRRFRPFNYIYIYIYSYYRAAWHAVHTAFELPFLVAKSVLKTRQKHQMRENESAISRQVATDGFSPPNALPKSPIWRQVAKSGNPAWEYFISISESRSKVEKTMKN